MRRSWSFPLGLASIPMTGTSNGLPFNFRHTHRPSDKKEGLALGPQAPLLSAEKRPGASGTANRVDGLLIATARIQIRKWVTLGL
jgi:hypothetical protein